MDRNKPLGVVKQSCQNVKYSIHASLAAGATINEFVEWFPDVEERQVRAVLEHMADALKNGGGELKPLFDRGTPARPRA